jgi:peptidyl-tRNA hydrolase, PTH1 family
MTLVIGLGNPGREYTGTRHNVGFELVDRLANQLSAEFTANGPSLIAQARFKGESVQLVKPLTFMNRSGQAVKKTIQETNTPLTRTLICYDDIHLEPGKIRLRPGGSAGGHNGLTNIISSLQTDQFPRLRIGIGNQFDRGRLSDYVLSSFSSDERTIMDETIERASEAVLTFIRTDIQQAMNDFN